jgi:tetratricopeptide (TPR) repeat protein
MGSADERSLGAPEATRSAEPNADGELAVKGSVPRGCAILVLVAGLFVAISVVSLRLIASSGGRPLAVTPPPTATAVSPAPAIAPTTEGDLAPSDIGFVDGQGGTGWGNRCWAHLRAGRYDWARAACERGLALNPARPYPRANLLYNMGLVETHDAHPDVARRYLQESLALRPASDLAGAAEVRKALAALGAPR